MKKTLIILGASLLLVACNSSEELVTHGEVENQPTTEVGQPVSGVREEIPVTDIIEETLEVGDLEANLLGVTQKVKTTINFQGKALGIMKHEGTLPATVEVILSEDTEDFTIANVMVKVDLRSMATDNDGLTKHLSSEDFFEVDSYPEATFESTEITENADGAYNVTGDLTLKGQVQSITLENVKMNDDGAEMEYELNLSPFGVVEEGHLKADNMTTLSAVVSFE